MKFPDFLSEIGSCGHWLRVRVEGRLGWVSRAVRLAWEVREHGGSTIDRWSEVGR